MKPAAVCPKCLTFISLKLEQYPYMCQDFQFQNGIKA